ESEVETEIEIEPQETEAEAYVADMADRIDRVDENSLLGTEDWGDETDESDESIEGEQATMTATAEAMAESTEVATTMTETAELSQEEQLIAAEQAYEDPLEISEEISERMSALSNRPSMGASEANAEHPQGAGWDTSEPYEPSEPSDTGRIPTGLSMADMTDMTGFTFPLADHTIGSILNIISMIYTRGPLLSKATGGNFGVDKDLITILADDNEYESKEFLVDFIREHVEEGARLDGISFTDTHVIFTGFPQAITDNATTDKAVTDRGMTAERGERDESLEKLEVFKRLAARMNKMAKEQKRIVPKEITEPNEKYALRIWLIRLGMNGADCKLDRKILLQNLSGHTAFRTEADKEKWIARQNAKKGKRHVVYEGPTDTTITEPMATNAPNTLTATETATALMATESTITAKEAL
ncbi:MAG: hypothetical protein IJQ24_07465, partial [Synergistaceae bacterium]|nr:hypothetical protein [Synergistaceae bacterium]